MRVSRSSLVVALVAGLGAVEDLVGPLDRVLARGPLAGVVHAHLQEGRLAVADAGVAGDLDPGDGAALVGLLGQGEEPDLVRVLVGERLELLVVVEEPAVGAGAAAGQAVRIGGERLGAGRGGDLCAPVDRRSRGPGPWSVRCRAGRSWSACRGPACRRRRRRRSRGRRSRRRRSRSLRSAALSASVGVETRTREGAGLGRSGISIRSRVQARAARGARATAELRGQLLAGQREAGRDLVGTGAGAAGNGLAAAVAEDRQVPVAAAAVEARVDVAEGGRGEALGRRAAAAETVAACGRTGAVGTELGVDQRRGTSRRCEQREAGGGAEQRREEGSWG